ncbi:P-loop NTPase [Peptoniphilaceae bacterium SGI.137]|nr:Mrp/NBP35 family ATP-binding protein [Peptoniphilaceae bacterium]MDY4196623.1 Mrp/NBP35 family ATP-binding protein [Peptoniphilaceae bacterium]
MAQEKKKPIFYKEPNEKSTINHVIAVMSGKGGVGKSMVTSLAALAMERAGWNTAILDADITGPSIPHVFGLKGGLELRNQVPYARETKSGIQIASTNLILSKETDPVLWKGPLIAQAVGQFWTDIVYENVDYMFVDMPPGTGDVPLTVFQTLPLDGVIIVTSPQDLVSMIVEKAINMTRMMGIPVVGIVENMSYFKAPDTGKEYSIFGESHVEEVAARFGVPVLAKLPILPEVANLADEGCIEQADTGHLKPVIDAILNITKK